MKIKVVLFVLVHLYFSRCAHHIIPCRTKVFRTIHVSWHIINRLLSNQVTHSIQGNTDVSLLPTDSQGRSVLKSSGFVFPCTDRVTRSVNSNLLPLDMKYLQTVFCFILFRNETVNFLSTFECFKEEKRNVVLLCPLTIPDIAKLSIVLFAKYWSGFCYKIISSRSSWLKCFKCFKQNVKRAFDFLSFVNCKTFYFKLFGKPVSRSPNWLNSYRTPAL